MLMLAIGWQMYGLTGSAWDLGLVGLAQFAPSVAAALPAGHAADRFHRARLVLACYAVQSGVALLLLAATHGRLGVARRVARAVRGAGRLAPVPDGRAAGAAARAGALGAALARHGAGLRRRAGAVIGGPALAGLLFAGGVAVVYGTCFALFAAGCVVLTTVRYEHTPAAARAAQRRVPAGRREVHRQQPRAAGRRVAGPVRRAAGRRDGAAADLRGRDPARGRHGSGPAALRARGRRVC
jgi:MFS family permease